MWGFWNRKTEQPPPPPPRDDLVPIPKPVPIPEGADCYFDPFDLDVRRRSLGRLPEYRNVVVSVADVHAVAEEEKPAEGEEVPPEKWEDDSTAGGAASAGAASTEAEDQAALATDADLIALIAKERAAVDEIRVVLELPVPEDDQKRYKENLDLLRFLRAREFKIPAAAEMYKAMLAWRQANHIDTILQEPDPLENMFQSFCGHRNHGYSYEGHPIYYERTGLVRVAEMLKHCASEDDIINRHIRFMEYAMRRCLFSSMTNRRNVEKIIMIHDLAHLKFTVETVGVKIFTRTVTIDQQMYPERLHKVFIINAPLSFRGAWAIVKPFIDPKTSQKIKILGSNFQESMLKQIPLSQLPEMYGGNCRCEYENGDHCVPWVRVFPPADAEAAAKVPEAWPQI